MFVMSEFCCCFFFFFFFKQKTAYEMRISDWSSDVCSSDLKPDRIDRPAGNVERVDEKPRGLAHFGVKVGRRTTDGEARCGAEDRLYFEPVDLHLRSEEHTSELQSLMRISYAVFCLKKKKAIRK